MKILSSVLYQPKDFTKESSYYMPIDISKLLYGRCLSGLLSAVRKEQSLLALCCNCLLCSFESPSRPGSCRAYRPQRTVLDKQHQSHLFPVLCLAQCSSRRTFLCPREHLVVLQKPQRQGQGCCSSPQFMRYILNLHLLRKTVIVILVEHLCRLASNSFNVLPPGTVNDNFRPIADESANSFAQQWMLSDSFKVQSVEGDIDFPEE